MSYKNFQLLGQGNITSAETVTIETTNAWHFVDAISPDIGVGLTVGAGDNGAITAFADATGGQVTVTSAGHGLSEDEIISIVGTTNYNGVFVITNVTTDTFEITDTWVADDATGTWIHGTHAVIGTGQGGYYLYMWSCSCTAAAANTTFEFAVFDNSTAGTSITRKFSTNTDAGAMAGQEIILATPGQHLAFALRNTGGTQNININNGTWSVFKIS